MRSGRAIRQQGTIYLQHRIHIPTEPVEGAFVLGDRVKDRRGREGVVVAINIAEWEGEQTGGTWPVRPYQVVLDDQPQRLLRFDDAHLTLLT